jgi:transposase
MRWGMRPQGTRQQLERRRLQAIRCLEGGKEPAEVARWLGASMSSVSRWRDVCRENVKSGLRPKPTPGRPPRLSMSQKACLVGWLLRNPLAYGYDTVIWSLKRVARLIENRFHVRYHPNHVWRLLTGMYWSCQKPEKRAREREEEVIAHWKRYVWPHIRKGRRARCSPGVSR